MAFQGEDNLYMLNGRPFDATGLPISLLDPILATFQDDVEGGVEPDEDDIEFVLGISSDMCSLSFLNEDERRDSFQRGLSEYLRKPLLDYSFGNRGTTDGSLIFLKENFEVPLLNLEVKPEFGMGDRCAYMQATTYYLEFINRLKGKPMVDRSRFPVFLIYLAGTYTCFIVIIIIIIFSKKKKKKTFIKYI